MDCHDFRKNHLAFVDDTLPGVDMIVMQQHLLECEGCSYHDSTIRRSLVLVRNLPAIEPSRDFSERLCVRLRNTTPVKRRLGRYDGPRLGTFMAAAASVVVVGYVAVATLMWNEAGRSLTLPPVIASAPSPVAPPIMSSAVMASISTGMPAWPAVLIAEQVPIYFVNAGFRPGGATR